ncbi:uncharacterized protein WCC33_004133 [Rhinophrynus dorsalis]
MPKCIVESCPHKTGEKSHHPDIMLHCFPKNLEKIRLWLAHTGQNFHDLDQAAQCVFAGKKYDNFRICSAHFTEDSYTVRFNKKVLRDDAVPTIFPITTGESPINEKIFHRFLKRQRMESSYAFMSNICCADASTDTGDLSMMCDTGTQTDISCFVMDHTTRCLKEELVETDINSINYNHGYFDEMTDQKESLTSVVKSCSEATASLLHAPSTSLTPASTSLLAPAPTALMQVTLKDLLLSDLKVVIKDPPDDDDVPLPDVSTGEDLSYETDVSISECSVASQEDNRKDPDFELDSEISQESSIDSEAEDEEPEQQMVNERKFLVFESCLDTLFYKLTCESRLDCNSPIISLEKKVQGGFLSVFGHCISGHEFLLWESQPKLNQAAVGNILYAAAIHFCGSNLLKVLEVNNVLGLQQISEATYYRYQKKFLLSIDQHSKIPKKHRKKKTGNRKKFADDKCSDPGLITKYCVYALMNVADKKILDFET